MSSVEIAVLTGKLHENVLKDIRRVLEEVEIDAVRFDGNYKDSMNRKKPCYNLPRRECDLVVSGYSVKYRLAIIDRWQELEAAQPKLPTTYAEALRLAADEHEARIRAEERERIAIETKAQISDSKTATALNTASQASKKIQKLESELEQVKDQVEQSATYRTIRLMNRVYPKLKFPKFHLDLATMGLGLNTLKFFNKNGSIELAYHRDAWFEAYRIRI
jgi:phage regulator Rha-like protein